MGNTQSGFAFAAGAVAGSSMSGNGAGGMFICFIMCLVGVVLTISYCGMYLSSCPKSIPDCKTIPCLETAADSFCNNICIHCNTTLPVPMIDNPKYGFCVGGVIFASMVLFIFTILGMLVCCCENRRPNPNTQKLLHQPENV